MKKKTLSDVRIYRVRFKYPEPTRYYYLSGSSGYPSAEYRMPYTRDGEYQIVVRQIQE